MKFMKSDIVASSRTCLVVNFELILVQIVLGNPALGTAFAGTPSTWEKHLENKTI